MITGSTSLSWEEATKSFFLHKKATRSRKTADFYRTQLTGLMRWALDESISLETFGKSSLDAYLATRLDAGISQTTLHHDALCAKVFLKWCVSNDVLERSRLDDYQVRDAPTPNKYMPTDEDMAKLLAGVARYWDTATNPKMKEVKASRRSFHRDKNYAIILMLLDTAARVGEILSLKIDEYRVQKDANGEEIAHIIISESKSRKPRTIPVSPDGRHALNQWLAVRKRVMGGAPKGQDEGYLFISEAGTRVLERVFLRALKNVVEFAGAADKITLHSLRRYSLNKLAKHNLMAAQAIAGHTDPKTTMIYTKIDPDFIRQQHEQVGVLRGILQSKRVERKKRLI